MQQLILVDSLFLTKQELLNWTSGGGSNKQQIYGVIAGFPPKNVHKVWVGNLMTPATAVFFYSQRLGLPRF